MAEADSPFFINRADNKIPEDLTTGILRGSRALSFHLSLPVYRPTPIVQLPCLARKFNVRNIYVKDESLRFGLNAFKGLGASYAIHEILKVKPQVTTFCTATDGNHGRAVAWAAKFFNKESVVFVPGNTTKQRIVAIEEEGATVIPVEGNYDKACFHAESASIVNGWELVQDMSLENYEEVPAKIMAGYLTLFQEIEDSLHEAHGPKIDIVFLQAGVGSFAGSGIFYYLEKYSAQRPKIVIVEPREADAILSSFKNGGISSSRGNGDTIMAGLNCATPSKGAWSLLKSGTDISLRIDDKYSEQAIKELYFPTGTDERIISGESGVGGLAGFIAIMSEESLAPLREELSINQDTDILFISTEGITDSEVFTKIIKRGLSGSN